MTRSVKIGAGCSVDITLAIPQMVRNAEIDYLVIDFMFETGVGEWPVIGTSIPKPDSLSIF